MSHRPTEDGAPLHAVDEQFGDVYERPRDYAWPPFDRSVGAVLRTYRGRPDGLVRIFRAVPASEPATIRTGDWVTITRSYAEHHRESQAPKGEPWVVLEVLVPAREVRNGGSDVLEWGYWGADVRAQAGPPMTWHYD